jgi:hypothetical protein
MPTNLTGSTINSTYDQLLHIDGGPVASEQTVYSGTGVATALKLGTVSASVENIQLDGNTISTLDTNGNLVLAPNGTGSVSATKVAITGGTITGITDLAIADGGTGASDASGARTNLGLGTIATQAANNVSITGGSITGVVFTGSFTGITGGAISGVTFTGSFSGVTSIESGTFATSAAAAGCNLNGNTLAADGTDTNIDINITPKGTGEVNVTNIDILSGKVPFNTITNRSYGIFYDLSDQTFTADTATAVEFDTTGLAVGVSVVSNTRITFAAAGVYEIVSRLQFQNTDTNDRLVDIWFRLNGTDIPYSASEISIPKAADGGKANHAITGILQVTAGQYLEVIVAVEDADTTLHHHAPIASPYVRPDVPSVVLVANRIA